MCARRCASHFRQRLRRNGCPAYFRKNPQNNRCDRDESGFVPAGCAENQTITASLCTRNDEHCLSRSFGGKFSQGKKSGVSPSYRPNSDVDEGTVGAWRVLERI